MIESVGFQLLSGMILEGIGLYEYAALNLSRTYFLTSDELELFDYIEQHVQDYGKLPAALSVEKDTGHVLDSQPEPYKYYYDKVLNRNIHTLICNTLPDIQTHLNNQKPMLALDLIKTTAVHATQILNTRDASELSTTGRAEVLQDYSRVFNQLSTTMIRSFYPTLDAHAHEFRSGDVITIVARPGQGKTYLMLNIARKVWAIGAKNVLFISMEMQKLSIAQRLVASILKIPITYLIQGRLPTNMLARVKDASRLQGPQGNYFRIVEGQLVASIDEVILLVNAHRPDFLCIDGGYLIRAAGANRRAPWESIQANLTDIKYKIAMELGIPVMITYQLNREAVKKERHNVKRKLGLDHVAGGDSIGQLSSIILAIDADADQGDSTDIRPTKLIDVLKCRDGPRSNFKINWCFDDYPYMDFDEPPKLVYDDEE